MIGIEKNRTAFYVGRITGRKSSVLFVERAYDAMFDGEPVTKIKIEPVAFFKGEEEANIFKTALERMFADGSCGAKSFDKTIDITLGEEGIQDALEDYRKMDGVSNV